MKKQLFRVKQFADQTFRTGKTEKLSDDLQAAEKRVEFIRNACQTTSKKLASNLLGQGNDVIARDKRLKKSQEYSLGSSMVESCTLEDEFLLRNVVHECGKLEMCLANVFTYHDSMVEARVVIPLQQICEIDVPNVMKHRRNLTKYTAEMESARARYQAALDKHGNSSSISGTKLDSLKDEMEEAEAKVEQCRDQLACEMFQLISREADIAKTVLEYAKLQKIYHETAVGILNDILPEVENSIGDSSVKPVFGFPLEDHLRVTGRKIAYPIELCTCALLELGMEEEGLFRVAGGASKVRRMKLSFDAGLIELDTAIDYRDPHIIAGVLKSYLRELPEPLLTYNLYEEWMAAARESGETRLQSLWSVVQKLPKPNLENLRYLIKFLSMLSKHEANKMTPQNIAIVIAPNLIWSPTEEDGTNIGMNMNTANLHSVIVDILVSYADWFFPEDCEMYVTVSKEREVFSCHTRSSSADTQLINVSVEPSGIKRTQSNSSLSDHNNSPPHGSPKPTARVRKNKPAPVPPKDHQPSIRSPNANASNTTNLVTVALDTSSNVNPNSNQNITKQSVITRLSDSSDNQPTALNIKKHSSEHKGVLPVMPIAPLLSGGDSLSVSADNSVLLGFEKIQIDSDPMRKQGNSERKVSCSSDILTSDNTNKLTDDSKKPRSSSNSDLPKQERSGAAAPSTFKGSVDPAYGTLDRKKPPRPTPLPRTFGMAGSDDARKPAIPERPATLQRPHSASFRIPRTTENISDNPDTGDRTSGGVLSLERAHVYSVDKQQVSYVHVGSDLKQVPSGADSSSNKTERGDSHEKPERPPKPEILVEKPQALNLHRRTPSEGQIIDQRSAVPPESPRTLTRPIVKPPPPPNTVEVAKNLGVKPSESTNL